jgi:hypothetical protein
MFSQDRQSLRRMFFEGWRKAQTAQLVTPLEQQIIRIVEEHPEYHSLLRDEAQLSQDFELETGQENPFLHMAMHQAIREQVATDRPAGIRKIHQTLSRRLNDHLDAEHRMMDCLGIALWEAQRHHRAPDETTYLDCLRKL